LFIATDGSTGHALPRDALIATAAGIAVLTKGTIAESYCFTIACRRIALQSFTFRDISRADHNRAGIKRTRVRRSLCVADKTAIAHVPIIKYRTIRVLTTSAGIRTAITRPFNTRIAHSARITIIACSCCGGVCTS
jgi:hypothetical protein